MSLSLYGRLSDLSRNNTLDNHVRYCLQIQVCPKMRCNRHLFMRSNDTHAFRIRCSFPYRVVNYPLKVFNVTEIAAILNSQNGYLTKRSSVKLLENFSLFHVNFSLLLPKTGISQVQHSDKHCITDAKFPNIYEFTHLQVKQKGKTSVES